MGLLAGTEALFVFLWDWLLAVETSSHYYRETVSPGITNTANQIFRDSSRGAGLFIAGPRHKSNTESTARHSYNPG